MMYKKGVTALVGAVLLVGLVMGCKDLLHPIAPDRVVTFDLQGGNINGATSTRKVSVENEGQLLSQMPPEPSRDGHTFGDWYTATNGGGTQFTAYTTVTKDITVYARWIAVVATPRTVTFDLQGGNIGGATVSQTRTVDSGTWIDATNMPTNPSKSGYTFSGWYTEQNSGGSQFTAFTIVNADITVYARWIEGNVTIRTVTFDLQGGNISGSTTTQTRTVVSGSWLISTEMPTNPSKSGYIFDGWWTAINGGGTQFTATYTTVNADITVYAKWTETTPSNGITNITYSSVSGGEWTLQDDGSRKSPTINGNSVTKARISFTSTAGASITILLRVSSEEAHTSAFYDGAFISQLDNASATYDSGYYPGSVISGETSVTVTIPIASAGSHFIDIGYRKDGSLNVGGDCAWFTVISDGGESTPSNLSLAESLTWVANNAVDGGAYTITVNNNESIMPTELAYSGKNVRVSIVGGTVERTISLSADGSLLTINSGATLTLGNNITLQGRSNNTASLVQVSSGGTLIMNDGSKISGNSKTGESAYGSGVYVYNGGTLTMNGGTISGNTASSGGGGVYMRSGSTFTMNGGTVSDNEAPYGGGVETFGTWTMSGGTVSGNSAETSGGGVYNGGTLTMSGGTVNGNTATFAGGVYNDEIFTMSGGTISGNTASEDGGGVYVHSDGTFTMRDGAHISDNEAVYGGGLLVFGTFTMENGIVSDNTAETSGGGIYDGGTTTVSGGAVSGNTATYGGGVFVSNVATFTMQSGGTIYGSNAGTALKNTATSGGSYGHAVYVNSSPTKVRNSTAGSGVTLNSAVAGTAGGWETATSATPSVQIDLRPAWNNPLLDDVSVFVNEAVQFSTDSEYTSWAWYWNGERVNGASASTYTMAAHSKTPGVYELSVVVTTSAGETLSAQCWVTIKAN
jgi:uncharacterized repeat protein (TIGR02543 family)